MENSGLIHRLRAFFVAVLLLLAPMFIIVAFAPTAAAAVVTPGVTVDLVDPANPYIRDDSSAIPLWGFGATSDIAGADTLWVVQVVFDTPGGGLNMGEIKGLNVNGATSGVALFRDDGAVDDELDALDNPLMLGAIGSFGFGGDDLVWMIPNNEFVPTAGAIVGNYQWFIVVRTDDDIDDNDWIRTYINTGFIMYSTGASQPAFNMAGTSLDVRESDYYDVGTNAIGRNLAQAALAFSIVDGGDFEYIDFIDVEFTNWGGFQTSDLAPLNVNPATSGVALYRDDGWSSDSWDAGDTGLTLSGINWVGLDAELDVNAEPVPDRPTGSYEYFIVIRTSNTIANNDQFMLEGDENTIRIDGTPNAVGDQNLWTPENPNGDMEWYTADVISPTITSWYWSEGSSFLHRIGGTLWFSSLMTSSQTGTFNCFASDNVGGSGMRYGVFSYEGSLGSGGGTDTTLWYTYNYRFDATDTDASSPATVTVYDRAGNTDTEDLSYAEDNTPPTVTITAPTDLDTLSGTVLVRATANDVGAGVNNNDAYVSWDGVGWRMMVRTGGVFEYLWDTTLLPDGDYRLRVRVRDHVYNAGTDFVNVKLDNTGPTSSILYPASGQYVHSVQNFVLWATATDKSPIASMQGRIDGGGWTPMFYDAPSGLHYVAMAPGGAGNHVVDVRATDTEGNMGPTASIIVIGDANDPTCTVASPSTGDELSDTITIRVSAADSEELDRVEVFVSGAMTYMYTATFNPGTGFYEVTIDTNLLSDGAWSITAVAYDTAGRFTTTAATTITVDNTEPSLAILTPTNGQYIYGTYTVEADAVDTGSGFGGGGVFISIDGGAWSAMALVGGVWTYGLVTTSLSDGSHVISVVAVDDAGNFAVRQITVFVDNTAPTVAVVAPSTADYVEGVYTFAVNALDNMGIKNVSARIIGPSATMDVGLGYNAASGYYEWTADTSAWADGTYTIKPYATELTGRAYTGAATITFYLDNNAPALTVVSPSDGEVITTTSYELNITASDGPFSLAPSQVRYRIDASPWRTMTAGAGTTWTANWDTTTVMDGSHTVRFQVTDAPGHVSTETVTVTVDNTDPTCMVVVPSPGQYLEGTATFAVLANDTLGVSSVTMSFTGVSGIGTVLATFNPSTGYWEFVLDTATVPDNNCDVTAQATDSSGRSTTSPTVSFRIDNNAPTLAVVSPTDGEVILQSSWTVTIRADDGPFSLLNSNVKWRVDAGPWRYFTRSGLDWNSTWDTTGVVDGSHALHFRVTDDAGHVTEESITVTVDNTDPECMIAYPSAGQYLEGTVTFAVKATDTLGIANVDMTFYDVGTLGTVAATYNPSTGYWEYVIDTSTVSDAFASVSARARDSSGRVKTATQLGFVIDNNAPTLTIDAPMDGEVILSATYDVLVQADDAVFGLSDGDVKWRVDNNPWSDMASGVGGWSANWFTADYADGDHTLHFHVLDAAGRVTEGSITVTVDNNDPTVALNTPSVGEFIGGVYTFSARAADTLGVSTVEMSFGFSGPAPLVRANATYDPSSGYWELTVDTTTLPDGPATLVLVATDTSGRSTTSGIHAFAVDNNAPELKLVAPLPGDILLGGDVDVQVNASDLGFDLALGDVEYSLDGTGWTDMPLVAGETTLWGFAWNASMASDGEHELAFRVTDGAGHVTEASVTFTVDNNDPTCRIVAPAWGEFAMGVYYFRVASTDALGVETVELSFEGIETLESAVTTYNPASGYWEFLIDTNTLEDTQANVSATSTDSSGRTSVVHGPINFTIDNNAPVLSFVDPIEGEIITEGMYTVHATAVDGSFNVTYGYVHLSIDGGGWAAVPSDVEGEFHYDWNTSAFMDGDHSLRLKATDAAGHLSEVTVNVVVDNHDPMLGVVAPTVGQYVTGLLVFKVAASDARGIVEVTVDWGTGPVMATINAATNLFEYTLDTTTLEDDTYTVTARTVDSSGRWSETTVDFQVDNHEPELTFEGPLTGEILDGVVTVKATALDAFVDSLQFSVDGIGWVDMEDGEGTFDSSKFADGVHTITVRAIDGSGKATLSSSEVTFDNHAPAISVADFPSMDEHVAGEMPFALFADDHVGVEAVFVTVDDETFPMYLNPTTGFYEWTFPTEGYADGEYTFSFLATDAAGHNSTVLAWTVVVDNTAPEIVTQRPADGDTVEDVVRFEMELSDATGVESVVLRIGEGAWVNMIDQGDGTYLYEWETDLKDNEENLPFTVRVTDTLGNTEDISSTITVDNFNNWIWVGLIIILVFLIVFGYWFMKRRRERAEEDVEEVSGSDEAVLELEGFGDTSDWEPAPEEQEPNPNGSVAEGEVEVELAEKVLEETQ